LQVHGRDRMGCTNMEFTGSPTAIAHGAGVYPSPLMSRPGP
jgi:hypothetical protein